MERKWEGEEGEIPISLAAFGLANPSEVLGGRTRIKNS
jgi:hypothetical protein